MKTLSESILYNLKEARYIYDEDQDYSSELANLKSLIDTHIREIAANSSSLDYNNVFNSIKEYVASDGFIITDKVEHAHGIGNNKAYQVVKDFGSGYERIGFYNQNSGLYGEYYIYLSDNTNTSLPGSYKIRDGKVFDELNRDIKYENISQIQYTIQTHGGMHWLYFNKDLIIITSSREKCIEIIDKYGYSIKSENTNSKGTISGYASK